MENKSFYIGIDVSKLTLDFSIINASKVDSAINFTIANTEIDILKLLLWIMENCSGDKNELCFCIENTGPYSMLLCRLLSQRKFIYTIVSGLELKKSIGLQRGKSDVIDAKRIATYAYQKREFLKMTTLADSTSLKLRHLITYRERILRCKVMFQNARKTEALYEDEVLGIIKQESKQMLTFFKNKIVLVEEQLKKDIQDDPVTQRQYELITSIPGIGLLIAANIIAYTESFSRFDSPRKFACYAGIAPFPYQSGTSVKGRTKVSYFANKRMKALLNLSALQFIQRHPEIKAYYQRKVKEGKNKMLVINAIRNKVLHRIFAVVKRGKPFVSLVPTPLVDTSMILASTGGEKDKKF